MINKIKIPLQANIAGYIIAGWWMSNGQEALLRGYESNKLKRLLLRVKIIC